jgi:hypothetical protein
MKKKIIVSCGIVVLALTVFVLRFIVFSVSWELTSAKTASMPDYLFDLELYARYNGSNEQNFFIETAEGSDIKLYAAQDYLLANIVVQCNSRVPGVLREFVGEQEPKIVLCRTDLPERLVYCDDGDGSDSSFAEPDSPCSILFIFFIKGMSREEADSYVRNAIANMKFSLIYVQNGFGAREQSVHFSEKDLSIMRSEE